MSNFPTREKNLFGHRGVRPQSISGLQQLQPNAPHRFPFVHVYQSAPKCRRMQVQTRLSDSNRRIFVFRSQPCIDISFQQKRRYRAILNLYGQFEPSPWQLLQLGFFSLKFHFGKSPPLSIKPEVPRVGESKRGSNQKQFPDNWRPARHFGSTLSFRILANIRQPKHNAAGNSPTQQQAPPTAIPKGIAISGAQTRSPRGITLAHEQFVTLPSKHLQAA